MSLLGHSIRWGRTLLLIAGLAVAGAGSPSTHAAVQIVPEPGASRIEALPPGHAERQARAKSPSTTLLPGHPGTSQPVAMPRAVLELFTSQACSACPPADVVLGKYTRDPTVIALTMPVDYWDYLGWKDTLAEHRFTVRQKDYAHARGDNAIYTPQMIVNGVGQVNGSDALAIEAAIRDSASDQAVMSVPIKLDVDHDRLRVDVHGEAAAAKAGEVWVYAVSRVVGISIKRGENRGRALNYYNVVRFWLKVGNWNGGEATFNVPLVNIERDDIDAAVVYLQKGKHAAPGAMLGAAFALLKPAVER